MSYSISCHDEKEEERAWKKNRREEKNWISRGCGGTRRVGERTEGKEGKRRVEKERGGKGIGWHLPRTERLP